MGTNDNFLNEEYDEYAEESLDDIVDARDEQTTTVLNEAMRRIEQAKLYEALLNHDLFAPDSARPEIIDSVKAEFKSFVLSRLEVLLGIKPEQPVQQAQSVFSDEEISALKALAGRALNAVRNPITTPIINPIVPRTTQIEAPPAPKGPVIRPVTAKTYQAPPQPAQPQRRQAPPPQQQQQRRPAPPQQQRPKRQKSQNVSSIAVQNADGTIQKIETDYAQAVNPVAPPLPMPSQMHQDMLNAQQAESNARGGGGAGVSTLVGRVIKEASK